MIFRDYSGRQIDDIKAYVSAWMKEHPKGEIYIGADSKVKGNFAKYAVVICLWDVGKGVREVYTHVHIPKPPDSFSRLWHEVTQAVEIAEQLKDLGKITVHVDINSNPRFRSHQLYDASMGFITSMGFNAAGKPYAWAATCGANKHCQ